MGVIFGLLELIAYALWAVVEFLAAPPAMRWLSGALALVVIVTFICIALM
jgi:hypothetical protein